MEGLRNGLPGGVQMHRRDLRNGLLFISPWIVGFLAFTAYPVMSSLYYSFTQYNMISPPQFVGLANYVSLFQDQNFLIALWDTGYMIVIGLSFITVATISLAILLNSGKIRGTGVVRTLIFIPQLVPVVVLSVLWIWILQPDEGVLNAILGWFGIHGPGWLSNPYWAKPAFILMALWGSGNVVLIYLAGLQDISPSLYEAASLDGASAFRRVLHITLPLLRPVILFNVITGMIGMFQTFAQSFIMTDGGPANSTLFYSLYLYQNAFAYFKMGYASAMAWILLLIVLGLTVLILLFTRQFGSES